MCTLPCQMLFLGCEDEISWMRFPGKVMRSAAGLQRGLT
jgi:hypothetical protein